MALFKTYTKTANLDKLAASIRASAITIALDNISSSGSSITVTFKADIDSSNEGVLDGLVTAHVYSATTIPKQEVVVDSTPAFAAKTITLASGAIKKLFKRVIGIRNEMSIGSNIYSWSQPYPWVKFMEIQFTNCEAGDYVSLKIKDNATGTYTLQLMGTAVPNAVLNQFGFTVNMPKDFYSHKSEFDADIYQGMVLEIEYFSATAKTVGTNFVMNELKD